MTQVKIFWPLLTDTHRYNKTLSTRNRGHGVIIEVHFKTDWSTALAKSRHSVLSEMSSIPNAL